MSNELKVTRERVLAAAAKCEDAKAVLTELFPEVFEDEKYFNFGGIANPSPNLAGVGKIVGVHGFFAPNLIGRYYNKGFYLGPVDHPKIKWSIERDNNSLFLVPFKK